MRKTAMQMAIDKIKDSLDISTNQTNLLLNALEPLLETEKQQIIEAWQDGGWDTHQCPVKVKTGTEYYNNEFQK